MISPGAVATELPEASSDEATRKNCANFTNRFVAIPAESVAKAIAYAIEQPADVEIDEIVIRPPPRSSELPMNMTATIKRIVTRWTLPALMLTQPDSSATELTEVGHHAFLIAGGIALARNWKGEPLTQLRNFSEMLSLELGK